MKSIHYITLERQLERLSQKGAIRYPAAGAAHCGLLALSTFQHQEEKEERVFPGVEM